MYFHREKHWIIWNQQVNLRELENFFDQSPYELYDNMSCNIKFYFLICLIKYDSNVFYIKHVKIVKCNYTEKCSLRIWKRYIPLLIDLLISNNFSSMTFFCATRILRVIGRRLYDSQPIFYWFFGLIKKKQEN